MTTYSEKLNRSSWVWKSPKRLKELSQIEDDIKEIYLDFSESFNPIISNLLKIKNHTIKIAKNR